MIQQSINQAMSIAGILASQSPWAQARVRQRELYTEIGDLNIMSSQASKRLEEIKNISEKTPELETEAEKLGEEIKGYTSRRRELAGEYAETLPAERRRRFKESVDMAADFSDIVTEENLGKVLAEKRKRQAEESQMAEQERLRQSRMAMFGVVDKPVYGVREPSEPSGYQTSLPLKTSEREPMYPKKGVK